MKNLPLLGEEAQEAIHQERRVRDLKRLHQEQEYLEGLRRASPEGRIEALEQKIADLEQRLRYYPPPPNKVWDTVQQLLGWAKWQEQKLNEHIAEEPKHRKEPKYK